MEEKQPGKTEESDTNPDNLTANEIKSPEEDELVVLVNEKKRVISGLFNSAIAQKAAFEAQIDLARSGAASLEPTVANMQAIVNEMQAITEDRAGFNRERCLRLNVLNRQFTDLTDSLGRKRDLLGQEKAAIELEIGETKGIIQSQSKEVEAAEKILAKHNEKPKPLRWLAKIFDHDHGIENAEANRSHNQGLVERIKVLEEELIKLSSRYDEVTQLLNDVWDTGSEYRWLNHSHYLKGGSIDREIIRPTCEKINQETITAIKPLKAELIQRFMKEVVEPDVDKRLLREELKIMTAEDFNKLVLKKIKDDVIRTFMPSRNKLIFSDQGCQILGIQLGEEVHTQYDSTAQIFTLLRENGSTIKTFPESEIGQVSLLRWRLKPGEKLGRYKIEDWSIFEQTLVLSDEDGRTRTIKGVDDLEQLEADLFGVEEFKGEKTIRIVTQDPHDYRDSPNGPEDQTWQVRNEVNGYVTLSRSVGYYNLDQRDALLADIREILATDDPEEKNQIIGRMYLNRIYRAGPNNHVYIGADMSRYEFTNFDCPLRLALLSPLNEVAVENSLEEILPYNSPDSFNTAKSFDDIAERYYHAHYQDFDYLLRQDLLESYLPEGRQEILSSIVNSAYKVLNKGQNSSCLPDYMALANFGDSVDLYQCLLRVLRSSEMSLNSLFTSYLRDEKLFNSKIDEIRSMMPSINALTDLFEQNDHNERYDDAQDGTRKDHLVNALSVDLRRIATRETTGVEEKRLIMGLLVNQGAIDPKNIFEADQTMNVDFARETMLYLRSSTIFEDYLKADDLSSEMVQTFAQDVSELYGQIQNGALASFEPMLSNTDTLSFLSRHPESLKQVLLLQEQAPDFVAMIEVGGELESNRDQLIHYLFADGNVIERAKSMVSIFAGNRSLPDKLITFVEARLKDKLRDSDSQYPTSENGSESVLFKDLSYEQKLQALYNKVSQSIAISRSQEAKKAATERNKQAPDTFRFKHGMYIHGLPAAVMGPFMRNGNLCGEVLGPSAEVDSYPFHVDYSHITEEEDLIGNSLSQIIGPHRCNTFGITSKTNEFNPQVLVVTDREKAEWEKDVKYYAGSIEGQHTLILGAAPTTEVHYALLRDPSGSLEQFVDACIEEEHYIPAYALETVGNYQEGQLVFSYEDYVGELEKRKPYQDAQTFLQEEGYLDSFDVAQSSSGHRFTLKNHLLFATQKVMEIAPNYGLDSREQSIVAIAGRLHDIGKGAVGEQVIDNPVVASSFLSQIQGLSPDDKELVLNLIRYDELLGDVLQGKKKPDQFERIFPDENHQKMLLTLYKADVQAIDGNEDKNSFYHIWQVEEKLKDLGLEREGSE